MRFSTKAIHAGQKPDPATGAIMTPVYLTSTYVQESPGKHKGFEYSRTNHPTRQALEENLAALEEGRYGLCFSSGLAAESAILALLKPKDHVVSCQDLYGGTYRLFTNVYSNYGIEFSFVDSTNINSIKNAIRSNTKMLWLESPTNPLLAITDIKQACKISSKNGIKVIVDNTFATPYLQQPLKLGADIVVHSTTKYLGGHSDVVGGAIILNDEETFKQLKFLQNAIGAIPGPLDCFLVLRGTKTLAIRMQKHCENAMMIAKSLANHKGVQKVYYPGLKSHPGHEIAKKQMRDFGGMISFTIKGGLKRCIKVVRSTKIFSLAESLGGVESLIGHPATMTHASIPRRQRYKIGVMDNLIRLSVGLEDVEDLIDDLKQAI